MYCRGKLICGDVDVIVLYLDGKFYEGVMVKFLESLKLIGFFIDDLILGDNG